MLIFFEKVVVVSFGGELSAGNEFDTFDILLHVRSR